jgi:1,4-alpha-glucan branching enzyme
MASQCQVALVLHAHMPYVLGQRPWSASEGWLHEAIWECYLPLVEMLEGLERDGVGGAITLSISPPLASMLADPTLDRRFERYLNGLIDLNDRQRGRFARHPHFEEVRRLYGKRLLETHRGWRRHDADLLGAFRRHHEQGRIELMTTAASHAYLPGLSPLTNAATAQLAIGRRSFATLAQVDSGGLWVPECGYDDTVDAALSAIDCRYTVLDEHALRFARPQPAPGAAIASHRGVVILPRDREITHLVWDPRRGYPGHPSYREFYRDLGLDLPAPQLHPFTPATLTGLKYHRITARDGRHKEPYAPAAARARVRKDAADFIARLHTAGERRGVVAPFIVAAFDAELFGHWWFEGPQFLDHVLRGLHQSQTLEAKTLGGTVAGCPDVTVAQPAPSSWGRGGFGAAWVGPRTAWLWRHIHHAHQEVRAAVGAARDVTGTRALARDQAVRELLQLQASDWSFMLDSTNGAELATQRLDAHYRWAMDLAAVAAGQRQPSQTERRRLTAEQSQSGFLHELSGDALCASLA